MEAARSRGKSQLGQEDRTGSTDIDQGLADLHQLAPW